jgi:hypothetical protein
MDLPTETTSVAFLRDLASLYGTRLNAERCTMLNIAADRMAALENALMQVHHDGQCCEASSVGKPCDSRCVVDQALRIIR